MPIYRIARPSDPNAALAIANTARIHGALVAAASPAAAVAAANALALARGFNGVFSDPRWVVTDIATTPGAGHSDTLLDGDFSTARGVWPGK